MAQQRNDRGFTLIELMVVVLVIAILIAIAVPTFLGSRQRAQDRATQSSLRTALIAARGVAADRGEYTNADETELASNEPSLTFLNHNVASTKATEISVKVTGSDLWHAAAKSKSGTCFYIRDELDGSLTSAITRFARAAGGCSGNDALAIAESDWLANW